MGRLLYPSGHSHPNHRRYRPAGRHRPCRQPPPSPPLPVAAARTVFAGYCMRSSRALTPCVLAGFKLGVNGFFVKVPRASHPGHAPPRGTRWLTQNLQAAWSVSSVARLLLLRTCAAGGLVRPAAVPGRERRHGALRGVGRGGRGRGARRLTLLLLAAAHCCLLPPQIGDEIAYRNYVDISVAVASKTGLVLPVIRNAESLSVVKFPPAPLPFRVTGRFPGKFPGIDKNNLAFTLRPRPARALAARALAARASPTLQAGAERAIQELGAKVRAPLLFRSGVVAGV